VVVWIRADRDASLEAVGGLPVRFLEVYQEPSGRFETREVRGWTFVT